MKINLNITQSWNELSQWQIRSLSQLLYSEVKGIVFDYRVLKILSNVRWWKLRTRWKIEKIIHHSTLDYLKESFAWFYSDLELTTFIPFVKTTFGKKLIAPADRIHNLTIDEFAHADDCFMGFHSSKKIYYLYYLAAVLYRENDENGKRKPFIKDELESRAEYCKKLDLKTLFSIFLCYNGSREYLTSQFKHVFPKPKGEKKSKKAPSSSGFGKIILSLSGAKFGNYNDTKNTNVYTFLSDFNEQLSKNRYA